MRATVIAIMMMLSALGCLAQTTTDSDSIFVISTDSMLLDDTDRKSVV